MTWNPYICDILSTIRGARSLLGYSGSFYLLFTPSNSPLLHSGFFSDLYLASFSIYFWFSQFWLPDGWLKSYAWKYEIFARFCKIGQKSCVFIRNFWDIHPEVKMDTIFGNYRSFPFIWDPIWLPSENLEDLMINPPLWILPWAKV